MGEKSPFVERLIKKGYEVLFLTEAVDEYAISALPEFEGKKFQNVAKKGLLKLHALSSHQSSVGPPTCRKLSSLRPTPRLRTCNVTTTSTRRRPWRSTPDILLSRSCSEGWKTTLLTRPPQKWPS